MVKLFGILFCFLIFNFYLFFRDVFAISGVQGKILDGWPIKTGNPILSNVIATHISKTRKTLDLVGSCLKTETVRIAVLG